MIAPSERLLAPKRAALGFFAGVRGFFGGLGFVVTSPGVWGWAMIPVAIATLLFGGLGALAIWGGSELSHRLLWDEGDGTWTLIGVWALRLVLWLVGVLVAFVVAMSLAQPLSGFALDAIARKQELALGGRAWPDQAFVDSTLRSLRVSLTALLLGLPVIGGLAALTFLVPPVAVVTVPLKFVVAGLLATYDLIDYPLGLRGLGVRARFAFITANFWAVLGFGVSVAAVLLVPGAALFVLPFGVAGATRMVVERDRMGEPPR
jgi:CysZ protein